jgi:transcription initiation factor IIE alpha subunit
LYNEKKRVPDYSKITGMSPKTVERYIGILRKNGLIDFTDEATQVGGYIVNPRLKENIK